MVVTIGRESLFVMGARSEKPHRCTFFGKTWYLKSKKIDEFQHEYVIFGVLNGNNFNFSKTVSVLE